MERRSDVRHRPRSPQQRQLDHAPTFFYIDNGSGLNAKLLTQEHSGFYERFSISVMNSLPGNPRARGIGEGLFRIIKERTDKLFSDTYCGHDQAGEVNRRLATEVRQGKRKLPTLMQYRDAVATFVNRYNNTKQKGLGMEARYAGAERFDPGRRHGGVRAGLQA